MDRRLKEDALIEGALKSQPLTLMPRSITTDVMRQIQTPEARRPAILTWSDLGLGFVFAACMVAIWFALANLPPILVAKLRIEGILFYQHFLVNSRWLVPALFFGMAALLAAITLPSLLKMIAGRRRQAD
ncbi:MAG: hypothetical protein ACM3PS_05065 [Syntrophothermus sp.]